MIVDKREAYKIVFNDLKKFKLFNGKYNAIDVCDFENENDFLEGIRLVIEHIALRVSENTLHEYKQMFDKNVENSAKRINQIEKELYNEETGSLQNSLRRSKTT